MIVKDLMAGYTDSLEEEYNPRTVQAYRSDINIFLNITKINDSSPAETLENIRKSDIRKYMASGKALPRTQKRRRMSLSRFFMYCFSEDIITSNPADEIEPLKREDANPSFIIEKEFDTLMESGPAYPNYKRSVYSHERDLSIMSLLFLDGFEISEILERTYEEITETRVKRCSRNKINAYKKVFFNTFGTHLSEELKKKFYRNRRQETISDRSIRRNFSDMGKRVLGRDDINPRTVHNGYLKIQIDEILAEDSETLISDIAEKTGAHFFTIQGLIKS